MMKTNKVFLAVILMITICCAQSRAQWVHVFGSWGVHITCLATDGINAFAGTFSGVLRSTDGGNTWSRANAGLTDLGIWCLTVAGSNLYAGSGYGQVFLSTDQATSWTSIGSLPREGGVTAMASDGKNLFAAAMGVWRSTDGGTSWTHNDPGLPGAHFQTLAISGGNIFAGSTLNGVFRSTDNGDSWAPVGTGLADSYVAVLEAMDTLVYAGTWHGVFCTSANGSGWTALGPRTLWIEAITHSTTTVFVFDQHGVYFSTDNGASWTQRYPRFEDAGEALTFCGDALLAGTYNTGIWRRSLLDLMSVPEDGSRLPSSLALAQNYPNPFNASTMIIYDVPVTAPTHLIVFDALGRQVATLVDETKQPGQHTIRFDGANLASGVYTYRLEAGGYTTTKHMVLIK